MSHSFEGSEIFEAPPERILALINNFESYKEFLPSCLESSRLADDEEGCVMGRLVFSLLNKTYAFESNNQTNGQEIRITQFKGLFLDFHALWTLEALNENQTKVKFQTKFTPPFVLKIIATQSMIDNIGQKFINAFANQLLK
jgi:ribosome-associated toxin RatA of RatAB toxin-antitoxin module